MQLVIKSIVEYCTAVPVCLATLQSTNQIGEPSWVLWNCDPSYSRGRGRRTTSSRLPGGIE